MGCESETPKTYQVTLASEEECQHLSISSYWMPDDPSDVSFQVSSPRLNKRLAEPPSILFLRKRRQSDPREAARQSGMEGDEMREPTLYGHTVGFGLEVLFRAWGSEKRCDTVDGV